VKKSQLIHPNSEREYEIQSLKTKFNEELSQMEKELNKYKSHLKNKDEESLIEKTKYVGIQKENDKLKSKIKELNEYISKLPTMEEVTENDIKVQ
jgi:hypothetical protein